VLIARLSAAGLIGESSRDASRAAAAGERDGVDGALGVLVSFRIDRCDGRCSGVEGSIGPGENVRVIVGGVEGAWAGGEDGCKGVESGEAGRDMTPFARGDRQGEE
jgi:hypothetical protein